MNKKIAAAATLALVLILTMCSSVPVIAISSGIGYINTGWYKEEVSIGNNQSQESFTENYVRMIELEKIRKKKHQETLELNSKKIAENIDSLHNYVNKTPYVFSGSTPGGWDCSGLVRWFYLNLGVDLYHRATDQMLSGVPTDTPKLGDIVAFKWNGSERAYHVGIYLDYDTMIHSGGKSGDITEIRSISNFGGKNSNIVYVRIIESN